MNYIKVNKKNWWVYMLTNVICRWSKKEKIGSQWLLVFTNEWLYCLFFLFFLLLLRFHLIIIIRIKITIDRRTIEVFIIDHFYWKLKRELCRLLKALVMIFCMLSVFLFLLVSFRLHGFQHMLISYIFHRLYLSLNDVHNGEMIVGIFEMIDFREKTSESLFV